MCWCHSWEWIQTCPLAHARRWCILWSFDLEINNCHMFWGILLHIMAYCGIFMHTVGIYHFHATSTAAAGRHSWMKTIPLSPSQMARTKILGSALIYSPSFYFSQNWTYNLRLKLPYWMGFIMVSGKDFFNISHPLISGDIPIFWVMFSLNPLASPAISNGFPYHSPHVC